MLTSLRAGSFPAAYCTIRSVPPAMGSHAPGSAASSDTTACKLPGATNWYSAGIRSHVVALRPCRFRDGFKNLDVAGAAAKISRKPFANLIHRRIGLLVQQVRSRQNHSRRADAALRAAALQECLLQMCPAVRQQPVLRW